MMNITGSIMPYQKEPIKNTGYPDLDLFLDDCFKTMREKGHDYREGNDDELLHNFKTVGEEMDLPPEKVWYIYASKHWKAIKTFIKEGGQSESEPIEGRIKDVIVYLLLFYRRAQDMKAEKKTAPTGPVYLYASNPVIEPALVERLQVLAGLREPPPRGMPTVEGDSAANPLVPDNISPQAEEKFKYINEVLTERDKEAVRIQGLPYTSVPFDTSLDVPLSTEKTYLVVESKDANVVVPFPSV